MILTPKRQYNKPGELDTHRIEVFRAELQRTNISATLRAGTEALLRAAVVRVEMLELDEAIKR